MTLLPFWWIYRCIWCSKLYNMRQPVCWLAGGCAVSQSEVRFENFCQLTWNLISGKDPSSVIFVQCRLFHRKLSMNLLEMNFSSLGVNHSFSRRNEWNNLKGLSLICLCYEWPVSSNLLIVLTVCTQQPVFPQPDFQSNFLFSYCQFFAHCLPKIMAYIDNKRWLVVHKYKYLIFRFSISSMMVCST